MQAHSSKMPVLFIGHGSPMNAIEDNDFTKSLTQLRKRLPKPKAVLCISAHWLTEGTWITHMEHPKTIHDFHGFPKALFDVRYPAPGSPAIAESVRASISSPEINLDDEQWGLDHGTWSVLRHLYPEADVPVLQLSINFGKPGPFHFEMGEKIRYLREQGVLIVGSGNIVHNLRKISWETDAEPFAWATDFDEWAKQKIMEKNYPALCSSFSETAAGQLSVPTVDHYYPLLYVLGAAETGEQATFEYEGIQNGSISMRTFSFGLA